MEVYAPPPCHTLPVVATVVFAVTDAAATAAVDVVAVSTVLVVALVAVVAPDVVVPAVFVVAVVVAVLAVGVDNVAVVAATSHSVQLLVLLLLFPTLWDILLGRWGCRFCPFLIIFCH